MCGGNGRKVDPEETYFLLEVLAVDIEKARGFRYIAS